MLGAEAGGVVAAVQDLEWACEVEAEKHRGGEAVDGEATMSDVIRP